MAQATTPKIEVWPVPPVTFAEGSGLALEPIGGLVDFYADAGCEGLFTLCLSGEALELTPDEQLQVSRRVVECAAGRLRVVAGGNFGATLDEQIRQMQRVAQTGVDAVVALISVLPNPDRLVEDLLHMAEQIDAPLGIYECPVPEHRMLTAEQVGRLARSGRFTFMKETSRNAGQCLAKLQAARGTALRVFPACFKIMPDVIGADPPGFCGVIANVYPELVQAYCNDAGRGDGALRRSLYRVLAEALDAMACRHYPATMKYMLTRRGLTLLTHSRVAGGEKIDDEDRERMDRVITRLRLDLPPDTLLSRLALTRDNTEQVARPRPVGQTR